MDKRNLLKPRLGISACLLGQKVRYDAPINRIIFSPIFSAVSSSGLPSARNLKSVGCVPREAVRLVGAPENPKLIAERSGRDWTNAMQRFAEVRTRELAELKLSGYVFKKNSPSCGVERVRIYSSKNMPVGHGRGLFAAAVMAKTPLLPVEEEGRLNDPALRENFIERVFAYYRWQAALAGSKSTGALVEFHTRHKYLLLAHSERHYRRLGRLVADVKKTSLRRTYEEYGRVYMEALAIHASAKKHANVPTIHGIFFRASLRRRAPRVNGIDPRLPKTTRAADRAVTLIQHFVKKYDVAY